MPKLYEYMGLVVLFYANEHDPVHVHCKYQGRECRADILLENGVVIEVRFHDVTGREPLRDLEMLYFKELVTDRAMDIVKKWIDFFVLHKAITPERISRRIK